MKLFGILIGMIITQVIYSQEFFTKKVNPDNQLNGGVVECVEYLKDIIVYNRGLCTSGTDSIYECASLVKYNQSGQEIYKKQLPNISSNVRMILADSNTLAILSYAYYRFDSLQLSLVDAHTFEIKKQIVVPNMLHNYLSNFNRLYKYNDKYVITLSADFQSNFYKLGKKKVYPYIYWINQNLTLDTIIKVDLPYGELYGMSNDNNGHLKVMAIQGDSLFSNTTSNVYFDLYKGYVTFSENKEFIGKRLKKIENSLWHYYQIQSLFSDDGTKVFIADRYNVDNTEIQCWDKDDNKLWVNKETYNQEKFSNPQRLVQCKNGDFVHTGFAYRSGMQICSYIHRIAPDGKTKWLRYYGYKAPNDVKTSGLGNWLYNILEYDDGTLTALGVIRNSYVKHATHPVANDSTWILRVDSMGCMEGNKCNDEYWWNGPEDWFQYDQLTLKHKSWHYQKRDKNESITQIEQRFGQDTTMYELNTAPLLSNGSSWARYKPVITKDINTGIETQDSIYLSWLKEGRVFGLTAKKCQRCRNYIMLYDFTLMPNDTFTLPYDFGKAIVTKVDSISLIPGYLRKRIILQHTNPTNQAKYGDLVWIEGIGSPNGILYYKDWQEDTQTQLTCYYDRGEKRYSSTNDPDCRLDVVSNVSGIADDATWYYTPASPTFQEKIWKVQALQDTTINNQVYKLIGIDKGQGIIHESKIPIAIVNKKMMFFEQGASHLIFDFAAQIGDTVTYKVPSLAYYYDITFDNGFTRPILPSFQMIVSSIDTAITIEGKMIKRFTTTSIVGTNGFGHAIFNLAENVGSITHGFFGSFGPYITQDKQGYFRCFQSSDLNFNILNKDCLLSNIADVNENRIKIYPNPSMDILNIQSDFEILEVNIRTVGGTSIYFNKSCPSTINISHFKSGIYFVEIRDKAHNLISISKVIKL